MRNVQQHLPQALKSGLAYGLGLGLGNLVMAGLFATVDLTQLGILIPAEFLLAGVGIIVLIAGIGSGIGGAIGGATLSLPLDKVKSRWSKAWRSGLSMGVTFAPNLYMLGLALSLFTVYTLADIGALTFDLIIAIFSALFGVLYGLLLGVLMIRGHSVWQATLASFLGFGIGGFGLGEGIRRYLLSITSADLQSGQRYWMVLGFLIFGLCGGFALGFVYNVIANRQPYASKRRLWHWIVVGGILILLLLLSRSILAAATDTLTPQDADLANVLDSRTVGTHWSDSSDLPPLMDLNGETQQPDIAVIGNEHIGIFWSQAGSDDADIYWQLGQLDKDGRILTWANPVNISNSRTSSTAPKVVTDSKQVIHIVWVEGDQIFYNQCQENSCMDPVRISGTAACTSPGSKHAAPTLAVNERDEVMAVWENDKGQLLTRSWKSGENPLDGSVDCVPTNEKENASQARLTSGNNGRFDLTYVGAGEARESVYTHEFHLGEWAGQPAFVSDGRWPNALVDQQDQIHLAWCSHDNEVQYQTDNEIATISTMACGSRPEIGIDREGIIHVVWFGDEVVDVNDQNRKNAVIYESILSVDGWTPATIVTRTNQLTQPRLTAGMDGRLHMVWHQISTNQPQISYSSFVPYACDENDLPLISRAAYDITRQPVYHPPDDIIPFCQNKYEQLVFTPNSDLSFTDQPPSPNGGFDAFVDLAQTTEYELLFSTMWYDADNQQDSPGFLLSSAVADLYQKIQDNPEQYPRGLNVRILLGNPPEFAIEEFDGQLFNLLGDLRAAGVDKMEDTDIGWRLEVANFDGAMPHSHTKVMIIDGKTILAAGFNLQYDHYDFDHPSNLGNGKRDLGILVTGPVAQASQRVFDDLWEGSDQRSCADFYPTHGIWQLTCRDSKAISTHVPEVMNYYLPGGDSIAFSMYRSDQHNAADQIVKSSMANAQQSVDAMHVMFSMDMPCDLNLFFNLCDFDESMEFMQGLMTAAENGAHIRLIVRPFPPDGIENWVAIDVFESELRARGLSDQVKIRFFSPQLVHYKSTLIDDEFLIVGSQNFHYSAFGKGDGLTEYNLGISDPRAVADFKSLFEYEWERATER